MVKKQGYLIPLINMLCSADDDSVTTVSDQESIQSQKIFLLLCPNVLLCANGADGECLCGDDGKPLHKVAAVCDGQVLYLQIILVIDMG